VKYKTIDLFAGIGGIRKGFELTGSFENVLSAEIDKYACITYEYLFGENPCNDVMSEEFKQKVANSNYDVLLAGFPCQAFSRAGKQEGFLDQLRGTLFFDIADILKRTRPKAFLLENVDNLLSHDKKRTFKIIIDTLVNQLDYKVIGVTKDETGVLQYEPRTFIRNSRNFGIPQNRPRVYIMGFDQKYFGDKINRLPSDELPKERTKAYIYENLNEVLEMGADPLYYLSQGYVETLKRHRSRHEGRGNGFGFMILNEPGNERQVSNALLATGGSGKERNLIFDQQAGISGTVVSTKKTPLNHEHLRVMTPREWGKLQGFINYGFIDEEGKDQFSFPPTISRGQQYKQFGNSVTIPVIEEMARFMKISLENMD
jgi:DNA (cytosine-5)-methyltransferase 1